MQEEIFIAVYFRGEKRKEGLDLEKLLEEESKDLVYDLEEVV